MFQKDDEKETLLFETIRDQEVLRDQAKTKEIMKNVRDGFGKNRKAFSSLGMAARGKFNLDDLVAADGSKTEAARLGLLESDEEMSEKGENDEEEDEEALMERMLIERHTRQIEAYISSSDESDEEEEHPDVQPNKSNEASDDEAEEIKYMKQFSARAKLNRRLKVRLGRVISDVCA